MGERPKKIGAVSILTTMITGLATWFFTIAKGEIPTIHSNIAVLESKVQHQKEALGDIKEDLRVIRQDQKQILQHLIQR
jgi:hypothetical protein